MLARAGTGRPPIRDAAGGPLCAGDAVQGEGERKWISRHARISRRAISEQPLRDASEGRAEGTASGGGERGAGAVSGGGGGKGSGNGGGRRWPALMVISDSGVARGEVLDERLERVLALARPESVVVQLRDLELGTRERMALGERLVTLCRRHGQRFVVNDRVDLAVLLGADG